MRARVGGPDLPPPAMEEWGFQVLRGARWPEGIICPWCQGRRVTRHTKVGPSPRRRYLCLGCRRTFTDLTGTPFARTNLPLGTWFRCLQLLGERRRTSDLAKALGVKWETAARMQRRLGVALSRPGLLRQLGEVMTKAGREEGAR